MEKDKKTTMYMVRLADDLNPAHSSFDKEECLQYVRTRGARDMANTVCNPSKTAIISKLSDMVNYAHVRPTKENKEILELAMDRIFNPHKYVFEVALEAFKPTAESPHVEHEDQPKTEVKQERSTAPKEGETLAQK